ncbi:hypothetical protein BDR05DRAFT_311894 [Suillus weaverae]|nr:hypothetical protein BDR05DRAFT_311894 [Suillus weaverae]
MRYHRVRFTASFLCRRGARAQQLEPCTSSYIEGTTSMVPISKLDVQSSAYSQAVQHAVTECHILKPPRACRAQILGVSTGQRDCDRIAATIVKRSKRRRKAKRKRKRTRSKPICTSACNPTLSHTMRVVAMHIMTIRYDTYY